MSFLECQNLKTFEIENGSKLLSISEKLFCYDMYLETLIIPENSNIKRIEANAFNDTMIKSLFIPKTLEELEDEWCQKMICLNEIIISPKNKNFNYLDKKHEVIIRKSHPNNTNFDTIAFASRCIQNLKIPNTIKYIDSYAFENCGDLNYIEIFEDSEITSFLSYFNKCSSFENIIIQPSTKKVNNKINYCYLDDENEIIVRKSDNKADDFDTIMFANRTIEYAFIPESIKFIDDSAFLKCNSLEFVEFSENSKLQQIGKYAFFQSSIQSITIPKSVQIIENNAFSRCSSLNEVIFEKGSKLLTIPKYLFDDCNDLSIVSIPKKCSLQKISSFSFIDTSIECIFLPETVIELEEGWFCGVKEVKISPKNNHFKYLDNEQQIIVRKSDQNNQNFDTIAFANRNIKRATIPKTIKYIDSYAFEECEELEFLIIPDDSELINIGQQAFTGSSIKSFIVPKNICNINEIFNNCSNLMSLEFQGELFFNDSSTLFNCPRLLIISLPNVLNLDLKMNIHKFSNNFTLFIHAGAKIN